MNIREVESIATSGALLDTSFRVDGDVENVTLAWDSEESKLGVLDYNINYNHLPYGIGTEGVKKVFLTYNGRDPKTGRVIETVVLESADSASPVLEADSDYISPGYNNSNEWHYNPSEFTFPSEILSLTNPADYYNQPYDYREGFTVVKQFLTANANLAPGEPAYTAFYRAPTVNTFVPANTSNNKIYVDGWYTSYVSTVKTWEAADPTVAGASSGDILYKDDAFYINTTGVGGSLDADGIPDDVNWKKSPTFEEWQTLMRDNVGELTTTDPIYFIETQHLVTVELGEAILSEVVKNCASKACDSPTFGVSHVSVYIKLLQKRLASWVKFNEGLYHEVSDILESSRALCSQCLYK